MAVQPRPALPSPARAVVFWASVDRSGGPGACWPWRAFIHRNGYGKFMVDRVPRMAHRVAFEIARGPIPEGLHLDHLCRNKACVNPAHLEPVTQAENNRRAESGQAKKTACPAGHPYDEANTYLIGGKRRDCRTCIRDRSRRRRERRAERSAA